jgi:hypothetical protein
VGSWQMFSYTKDLNCYKEHGNRVAENLKNDDMSGESTTKN